MTSGIDQVVLTFRPTLARPSFGHGQRRATIEAHQLSAKALIGFGILRLPVKGYS